MEFEILDRRQLIEDDLEIKVVNLGDVFLTQISSGTLRGTLVIQKGLSKDELLSFGEALHSIIQQFSMLDDIDTLPQ